MRYVVLKITLNCFLVPVLYMFLVCLQDLEKISKMECKLKKPTRIPLFSEYEIIKKDRARS